MPEVNSDFYASYASATMHEIKLVHPPGPSTGTFMLVSEHQLVNYTSRGWRLVAMYQKFVAMQPQYGHPQATSLPAGEWVPMFVVEQSADATLQNAQDVAASKDHEASQAHHKLTVAEREMEDLKNKLVKQEQLNATLRQQIASNEKELDKLFNTNRKFETSLGRVREQLGALRYKEIVGE